MIKQLRYFLICLFILTASIIFNPLGVQAQITVPSVSFVGVDHSPLVVGDTETFTLTSKGYSGKVQYRVFMLNQTLNKWTELTSGYSTPIDAAIPFALSPSSPFDFGKYTLRTYVKRYGQSGINKNSQCGGYDSLYTSYLSCVDRDDSCRVYANDSMDISGSRYVVGQKIRISGIKNISGMNGPYKYRLNVFSPQKVSTKTNGWVNGWKLNVTGTAYSDTIEWTPTEPGTYILDLWAISSDSTLWPYLKKNPTAKYYESWKLAKITVASDVNSYIINNESDLYNALKDGLTKVSPKIYLDINDSSLQGNTNKISELVNRILRNFPDLNCFDSYIMGYNYVSFKYLYSADKILEMRKQVDAKADQILSDIITDEMSDLDKEKAIHDYIVNNTEYDYDNFINNTIPKESNTAYGCLINKRAVCKGYAVAMWKLLTKAGIETIVVYGSANGSSHEWNIVKIDEKYYHVDATFDDPILYVNGVRSSKGSLEYTYFNKNDIQMAKDHSWDKTQYPVCN